MKKKRIDMVHLRKRHKRQARERAWLEQNDRPQPQINTMQTEAPGKRSEDSHPGREGNQEPKSDGGSVPVL